MKLIQILREYTEKTIQTTIERWKKENPKADENISRQLIQRFDQIKDGLSSKLEQISLSDELKKNNNYKNIDLYSFDDMVKLIRSLPESDDKIKKEAIKTFMEKEAIDKSMASHYVIRFMANKRNLKYAAENGTEDERFDKKEVAKFIPKHLMMNNAYLDPRAWDFHKLEHMLDALFPYQGKAGEEGDNTATTDADKVYNKNGLEIYKGDAQHKCVSYNPTDNGKKKYGWCIAQPGNSNYDYYRFQQGTNRMFYFVFDRSLSDNDKWHAFVVHVGEGNKQYWVTNSKNDGDNNVKNWDAIKNIVPKETWNKISGLESIFKYIPPSKAEISSAALRGKKLSAEDFKELDYDTKELYIQSNAGSLPPEILKTLDKELKNLAINYGQKFPYIDLKNNEGLAKRYAIFRFRHTNYSKDPIPLPYVKYLDEEAKQKYLETFEDNISFEYIEKYFGDKIAEKYAEKQIKNLEYLPKEAVKYIKDPKLKSLFLVYNKLFNSWEFGSNFNIDDNKLEQVFDMPIQDITPKAYTQKEWKNLPSTDKKAIINLASKINGNKKYATLLYALPYIIENDGKTYMLLPTKNNDYVYNSWVLTDVDGNVILDNINGEESDIKNQMLILGFPNVDEEPRRIYDLSELKVNGKKVQLKESRYDDWDKYMFMKRSGIIK